VQTAPGLSAEQLASGTPNISRYGQYSFITINQLEATAYRPKRTAEMLRFFTDFQAVTSDGAVWILRYDGKEVKDRARELNIRPGDQVILDAHEDFEVFATLEFKHVEYLNYDSWVAVPDWSTRKEK
jgi:hypothetical protein